MKSWDSLTEGKPYKKEYFTIEHDDCKAKNTIQKNGETRLLRVN